MVSSGAISMPVSQPPAPTRRGCQLLLGTGSTTTGPFVALSSNNTTAADTTLMFSAESGVVAVMLLALLPSSLAVRVQASIAATAPGYFQPTAMSVCWSILSQPSLPATELS